MRPGDPDLGIRDGQPDPPLAEVDPQQALRHGAADADGAGSDADGAGAVVLRGTSGAGRIGPVVLGSDGDNAELIFVKRERGDKQAANEESPWHGGENNSAAQS